MLLSIPRHPHTHQTQIYRPTQSRDWHLVLRNLPFPLCKPEGEEQLRAVINAVATASGLRVRKVQPLTRKEDGLPTGVVFALLEREGNGRVDVDPGAVEAVVGALGGREVGGRPVKAARWVRPTGDGGGRGGGRQEQD